MKKIPLERLQQEDILKYIIACIKDKPPAVVGNYGYHIYLPNLIRCWLQENSSSLGIGPNEGEQCLGEISPPFYEALWELCRLGVLRPGVHTYGAQSTSEGSGGGGYSITPFGRQWIEESDSLNFVPTEPQRFGKMLEPYAKRFGLGFHERAQQAIRCYGARAHLACAVMCGAAAESILLNLAIAKDGDVQKILKLYRAASGRKDIENLLIAGQKGGIKNTFEICFELLKYWRDEAAHGRESNISENEAYTSLALLMRSAQFASDNYDLLISK